MAALPVIAAVAGIAGTGISAAGALGAGEAQAANASYQAAVARNNAAVAQQNAAWTIQSGETNAATEGQKARAQIGSVKAAQGANNVDVNTGSAADVRTGAQELAGVDTRTIMSNSAKQAYGYETAAASNTAEAGLLSQESAQAQEAAPVSSLGSFLSGISSVGDNWLKYQSLGTGASSAGPGVSDAGVGIGMA